MTDQPIHVIHENPEWLPPFARAFEARGEFLGDPPIDRLVASEEVLLPREAGNGAFPRRSQGVRNSGVHRA